MYTVTSADAFRLGDILRFPSTGETIRVTCVSTRPDGRLWGDWDWSELSSETLAAIRHFTPSGDWFFGERL